MISDSVQWKRLSEHVASLKQPSNHLKNLLADGDRCAALVAEHDGILLDYSRENLVPETMDMLFDLAGAAGLEEKRANMASGAHINSTEDRAGT